MELVFFYLAFLFIGYALIIYVFGATVLTGYLVTYFVETKTNPDKQHFSRFG